MNAGAIGETRGNLLPHCLEFQSGEPSEEEFFASLPASSAVFLLQSDSPQTEPYISKTANLRRRLQRLLGSSAEGKKLNLRNIVRTVEYACTGSDFESVFLLYKLLRAAFPKTYATRLRLRFAPLLKLHLENQYPRVSVTVRLGRLNSKSLYYGPFPSRTVAEQFAKDALDFFKIRRCVPDLDPDPQFPGCIYSEMAMCLAPCFKGCTNEEYAAEVSRVQLFLNSSGESLVREISAQRDRASAEMNYESAAGHHARLEKLKPLLAQLPEIVHRLDQLSAILVQSGTEPECVALFRVNAGHISGPVNFSLQASQHAKSHSMEARLREVIFTFPAPEKVPAIEVMEHLALLKRWYYRSTHVGEIFFCDDAGELPMRRLVRGIARVYRNEKPGETELQNAPPGSAPTPAS